MSYELVNRRSFVSKVPKYLFLPLLVLCFSLSFNFPVQAQDNSIIECVILDDFVNTELPGNEIELDDINPGPVNVLDNGSPGVLGDIRDITLGPIAPPLFPQSEVRLLIEPTVEGVGILGVSNEIDTLTPLNLLYNAGGEGLNLDLAQRIAPNQAGLQFFLRSNDLPGTFLEIVLQDSSSNNAQTLVELPVIAKDEDPILLDFPIAEFNGINSLDQTDIQSIDFRITPSIVETDYALNAIEICGPRAVNIPTLSEWGLIAMAGILGIVGFLVIRRRNLIRA